MGAIASGCARLADLDVTHCEGLAGGGLAGLSVLTRLVLTGADTEPGALAAALACLTQLRCLHLSAEALTGGQHDWRA